MLNTLVTALSAVVAAIGAAGIVVAVVLVRRPALQLLPYLRPTNPPRPPGIRLATIPAGDPNRVVDGEDPAHVAGIYEDLAERAAS
jgi:hypothetical protein